MAIPSSEAGLCVDIPMSQETDALPTRWQEFPTSYFAPPSSEETHALRQEILRYAIDELHVSPEKAELYAEVFSTYSE